MEFQPHYHYLFVQTALHTSTATTQATDDLRCMVGLEADHLQPVAACQADGPSGGGKSCKRVRNVWGAHATALPTMV